MPPTNNPLGPDNLMFAYLTEATKVSVAAAYAQLVLEQRELGLTQIDAGLETKVTAYQAQMKQNAHYLVNTVLPNLNTTISDADNFDALINAGLNSERGLILDATTKKSSRKRAEQLATMLQEQAQSVHTVASTMATHLLVLKNSIQGITGDYTATLDAALAQLGADTEATASRVESLYAATFKNIDDVVKGNFELGGAITTLGIGMLTTIKPALDGSDGDSPEKDGSGGEDAPSADYAVSAIKSGSEGIGKASQAIQDLQKNNRLLAEAYQQLASDNALIAIAKSVGAQNQLFGTAVSQATNNAQSLVTGWSKVATEFGDLATTIHKLSDQQDAIQLTGKIPEASGQWTALAGQLSHIRQSLTGSVDGLPAVG